MSDEALTELVAQSMVLGVAFGLGFSIIVEGVHSLFDGVAALARRVRRRKGATGVAL